MSRSARRLIATSVAMSRPVSAPLPRHTPPAAAQPRYFDAQPAVIKMIIDNDDAEAPSMLRGEGRRVRRKQMQAVCASRRKAHVMLMKKKKKKKKKADAFARQRPVRVPCRQPVADDYSTPPSPPAMPLSASATPDACLPQQDAYRRDARPAEFSPICAVCAVL